MIGSEKSNFLEYFVNIDVASLRWYFYESNIKIKLKYSVIQRTGSKINLHSAEEFQWPKKAYNVLTLKIQFA